MIRVACLGVLLLGVASAWSPASGQTMYKNSEFGFKIAPPKQWKESLLSHNEKWIVAKFQCHKDFWGKKDMTYHRPDLRVLLFAKEVVNDRGVKVEKSKDDKVIKIKVKNPFKSFEDYLKSHASGGYYEVSRKETKINKIPVTCIELKFEKLTTPRRALAYIFHHEDADFACYVEGLEDYWKRLKPEYVASLRTFKFIKRTGSLIRDGGTSDDGSIVVSGKESKLTPKERVAQRKKKFDREVKAIEDTLPKSWRKQKSKNAVALTNTSPKYTTFVLRQAEAVRRWLDRNFAWIGPEKAGRVLIRICKDYEEENSLRGGSRDAWGKGFEVVTHRDLSNGKRSYEIQWVNTRVVGIWFTDKNPDLAWGMPSWLNTGIKQVLGSAVLKGSRLQLKPDPWEATRLRQLVRENKIVMPRDFLVASGQDFWGNEGSTYQAGAFMRFLLKGPKKLTKNVLQDYMRNLVQTMEMDKLREEREKGKPTRELTEEEEAARYKELKQRESKRLQEVFDLTFGDWSEKKWKSFDRAYKTFVGGK